MDGRVAWIEGWFGGINGWEGRMGDTDGRDGRMGEMNVWRDEWD